MTATQTATGKRHSKAARALAARKPPAGWLSSDAQEIERRQLRAAAEPIAVKPLEVNGLYGDYAALSGTDGDATPYRVEIRALDRLENSCSCMDYRKNGLGTCKHIESVLLRLRNRGAARFARAIAEGSPFAEVYLSRRGAPEVRALCPPGLPLPVRTLLDPYFTAEGRLLAPPAEAIPSLRRALAKAPHSIRTRVRVGRDVDEWAQDLARRQERQTARERFEEDVQAGKRPEAPVKARLYPYQREGMLHLAFNERALLADEMGLGKTVQAIAACELLRQLRGIEKVLVVSPASLKAEWEEQIARFTDRPTRVVWGARAERLRHYRAPAAYYLCNYEQALADWKEMNEVVAPDVIILDEAQRIKNWQTRTARTIKRLSSPYAFVLTGTPLENRIDEVYSIVEFLDPAIFGPLFRFNREFYALDESGRPTGFKNLGELHRRLRPVMLRRRKDEVEEQLPPRTVKNFFVGMEEEQAERYQDYEARVAKLIAIAKRRPLMPDEFDKLQRWLACMRMLCDTPYILDPECRVSPKLHELADVLEDLNEGEAAKIIVFSEWERMLELVRELARELGMEFAWHTGSVPQQKRRAEINRFKNDPDCRLFLSTDSGATGLNLQAASVVINLDLPWNPAKLEQRIARAWRKHQTRPVTVINLVCENSIEQRMLGLLAGKQQLADGVLDGRGDLAQIRMPSGRAAFMERLSAIMGTPVAPAETSPAEASRAPAARDPSEAFRQDLVARLDRRLLLLEAHPAPTGAPAFVAVVDGDAAQVRPVAERLLRESFGDAPGRAAPALELLDRTTFETIQRLLGAGVLRLGGAAPRLLHGSLPDPAAEKEKSRARQMAERLLAEANRKGRVARVLGDSGFADEAAPVFRQGIETGLRALAALAGAQADGLPEPLPPAWVDAHLTGPQLLPAGTGATLAMLRADATGGGVPATDAQAQSAVRTADLLLTRIEETVSAALLR